MSLTLAYISLALFAALPGGVLITRYRKGRALPWRLIVLIICVGGWFATNGANYFYSQHACAAVYGATNPPAQELAFCTNDGARNFFALFFGWLYALVYSIPFFLIFAVVSGLRRPRAAHAD